MRSIMADQKKNSPTGLTIMVYISADDMLANFAVGSLQQLQRVASRHDDVVIGAKFNASGKKQKTFLTPSDMGKALAKTALINNGLKFGIIGFDACNMSMLELACELPDYAECLIASQEEVSDFSFPYDKLMIFDKHPIRD